MVEELCVQKVGHTQLYYYANLLIWCLTSVFHILFTTLLNDFLSSSPISINFFFYALSMLFTFNLFLSLTFPRLHQFRQNTNQCSFWNASLHQVWKFTQEIPQTSMKILYQLSLHFKGALSDWKKIKLNLAKYGIRKYDFEKNINYIN